MSSDAGKLDECFKVLKSIRKGKGIEAFGAALTILEDEAHTNGLSNADMKILVKYITKTELRASHMVPLIKCLIPHAQIDSTEVEDMIGYLISAYKVLPITVSVTIIQWIIGLWEHQLVSRQTINAYYDCYFYMMLKKDRLESHLARLIYLLTKPDDVTRRQANRLLNLQSRYSRPQKHINALLSLYKSYKPELVPEKIPSMNIGSVWKPIPESLRIGFESAKERCSIHDNRLQDHFDWNVAKTDKKKSSEPLLPSVRYYHIGSSIYRDKDSKSIFDLVNFDDVGKHHLRVEMPSNAVSLLANTAGYHFLTFASFQYQSRFSYNLYNTLQRAFVLERGKFSEIQMEQLLDMTIEFSRYMQEGIPVVNRFLIEYFEYRSDDYRSKWLQLLEWCTSIPVSEFESFVVSWIHWIFSMSSLSEKCEIIKTLQKLAVNLFAKHGFGNETKKPSPFLGQVPASDLVDMLIALTALVSDLVISGLTIHSLHPLFMSASLDFYEEVHRLESKAAQPLGTIAPPILIYGGLISKSCAILSRVCALLLGYRDLFVKISQLKQQTRLKGQSSPGYVNSYCLDFANALWYNFLFSGRKLGGFLAGVSNQVIDDLLGKDEYRDALMSIDKHPAIMPYKYILSRGDLDIRTQEDVMSLAAHYFPAVSEFIMAISNN